jgi:hypothetical protein
MDQPPEATVRPRMVDWYNPVQLARTAGEVAVSTLFGRHSDYRLIEALADPSERPTFYDHTYYYKRGRQDEYHLDLARPREDDREIWIDYVADVGDGWNPTYAVAYQLAQQTLKLKVSNDAREHVTQRGEILVFGGDQVYPVASRENYQTKLVDAYEAAFCDSLEPYPVAYAIPGNHDWYDSLVSFTRLFCERRRFGGWRTQQHRSYFALKLPHHWWLIGLDVQLGSDIDGPQVSYFKMVSKEIEEEDRVILCNAEPHWVYSKMYKRYDAAVYNESSLRFLEDEVLKKKITVFIAGDLHRYQRHEGPGGAQKITSGGGGAFLHPTHGADVSELEDGFSLKSNFPDPRTSRRLCWGNFLFPLTHWPFGLATGIVYMITARAAMAAADVGQYAIGDIISVLPAMFKSVLLIPFSMFWVLSILTAFFLFTDTHSRAYRAVAGTIHGSAHLFAAVIVGWAARTIALHFYPFLTTKELILSAILAFAGGCFFGPLIMGAYLFVSLNVFGRHSNEAFSSLAIEDYKNFIRLRIDPDGSLMIFPVGLRMVPRIWRERATSAAGPLFVPNDPRATEPELIETPVVVS